MAQTCPGDTAVQGVKADPCTPPTYSSWLLLQVVVEGPTSSAQLHNLTSGTEYLVSVFPLYKAGVGEGLQGLATTGVCVSSGW